MSNKLKPDFMVESIYQLTPEMFAKHNVTTIFADLDNTLIAFNNPSSTKELTNWAKTLEEADIRLVVISNNTEERVQNALNGIDIHHISWALKPLTKGLKQATQKFNVSKENAVMVGDQLMTDILAAKKFGIRSILVKPILNKDGKFTWLNRRLENLFFKKIKNGNEWEKEI